MLALLSLFALFNTASAQEAEFPDVMPYQYSGIGDVDGKLYYTLAFVQNSTEKRLHVVGADLAEPSQITMTLGRLVDIRSSRASGDHRYLWIASDKNGILLQLDAKGKETGRRTFLMPNNFLNNADLYATETGLTKVSPVKVKKVGKGLRIEGIIGDLSTSWQAEFFAEKGALVQLASASGPDRVAVVAKGMKGAQEVVAVSHTGETLYRMTLDGGDKKLKASHIAVGKDGTVAVFGTYEGTGVVRESDKNGQHFVAMVDPSGKATVNAEPWSMQEFASRSTDASLTALPAQLHVHSIEANDGGFSLVGESYSWSGGMNPKIDMPTMQSTPQRFHAMDVYRVQLDAKGNHTIAQRLHKTAQRTQTLGSVNSFTTVSDYFSNYGRSGYKFTDDSGTDVIVSDDHNLVTVRCEAPGANRTALFPVNYLGYHIVEGGANRGGVGAPFKSASLEYESKDTNRVLRETQVLPSSDGSFVVAHYADRTVTLSKQACASQEPDDLLQGMRTLSSASRGHFSAGGAYVMYRVTSGEQGLDRYIAVVDGASKVHRHELDLPPSRVTQLASDSRALFVQRLGSVHHLAVLDRMGGAKTSTIDLGDPSVTGAQYLAGGDDFVVATTFRDPDSDEQSYTIQRLDGDMKLSDSPHHTGPGSLSLRSLGASKTHAVFQESYSADADGPQTRFVVFDRAGALAHELSATKDDLRLAQTRSAGGLLVRAWNDKKGLVALDVDGLDPEVGALTLDPAALQKALGIEGLAEAMSDGKMQLNALDVVPEGDKIHLVTELRTQGAATTLAVLHLTTAGGLKHGGTTVIPLTQGQGGTRYRGLVRGADGLDLVLVEYNGTERIAAAISLADPTTRRVAVAGLPKIETEPEAEFKLALEVKLEAGLAKIEQKALKLERLLGFKQPPPQVVRDPNTDFIPVGDGRLRVFRYHPEWHTFEWRTVPL